MKRKAVACAMLVACLMLAAMPAPAAPQEGQRFEIDLDSYTFYELAGGSMKAGFTLFNLDPATEEFTVECSGDGLTASPDRMTVTITGGGRVEGNFSITAPGQGEYPLTFIMRQGDRSARVIATAVFLPLLSCKFVSPATNERTGEVGVGQTYTGVVNFTNRGTAPLEPAFSLAARDLAGKAGADGSRPVTLQVGRLEPLSTRMFNYNGSSLPDLGTRLIEPSVKLGDIDALYGYDVGPAGVYNVTRFLFTLAARELLGVELSNDRFLLGQRAQITLYVESRKAGGITGGDLDVSLRTDIEARNELSDYAAQPRFEQFASLVRSGVEYDRHYELPPMEPGVQQALTFGFEPRICRATEAGGSFFFDFRADLEGTPGRLSVPVSVVSPIAITMVTHEQVNYAGTGEAVARSMTVRNLSNSTISGATARFFLDFRQQGFVNKADIAETPPVSLPTLAPGEQTDVALTIVARAPGTYSFFPIVSWGNGLSVYGSHIQVAVAAQDTPPVGPYIVAVLVIAVPVALMRRFSPP